MLPFLALGAALSMGKGPVGPDAQRLIVDTDMGFDVDDAVAVCLANSLHTNGQVIELPLSSTVGCARREAP